MPTPQELDWLSVIRFKCGTAYQLLMAYAKLRYPLMSSAPWQLLSSRAK
ncbi:MAG: hypothetical protein RLZZ507_1128 [Cyanobacteriota bacterium]|jgi:hypothetical protein